MRYLLDTQVLLWIFGESDKLSATATDIVKDKENDLFVSKASFNQNFFVRLKKHGLNSIDHGLELVIVIRIQRFWSC